MAAKQLIGMHGQQEGGAMLREKVMAVELDGRPLSAAHLRDGLLHYDDEHWLMGVWADATADIEEVFPCLDWNDPIPVTVRTQGFTYHGEGTVRRGTEQEVGRIKRVIIGHGLLCAVKDGCD